MKRIAILFFILLLLPLSAAADTWTGTVISVHDGDTLTVARDDGRRERIRLYGIDCPELAAGKWGEQPYGREATDFAKALLQPKDRVAIAKKGMSYRRIVAMVIMQNGVSAQEELVAAGLAWVDPKYCKAKECDDWLTLQRLAEDERRGLWEALDFDAPVPPWEWRRRGGR